jgi:polynucleotide 5'-hydroxyl-kinase GRC3/NOL9
MAGARGRATPTRTPPRSSSPAPRTEAVVPPDWDSAVSTVSSHPTPPVVVVCGPKNSGKSTFSRVLLNALLPRQATTTDPSPSDPDERRLRWRCWWSS